ncbi:MAG: 3-oxoacyl-ACP synthase [Bacteroidota bacterium]
MDKAKVHQHCLEMVAEKMARLEQEIAQLQQATSEETKSSAGDKFETSREMMKQEINKLNQQLGLQQQFQQQLTNLIPDQVLVEVRLGSLVQTSEGTYYLAVSLGKVSLPGQTVFAMSTASPLAQAMLGLKAGESLDFRGRKIKLLSLS